MITPTMLRRRVLLTRLYPTVGLQEVSKGPLGHLPALLLGSIFREAEMDALVDADINRVRGQVREALIRERVRGSQRVLAEDHEGDLVHPEEELEHAGQRANHVISARGVF